MGLSQNRWPFELKNYSLQKKAVPFGTAFLYTFFMLKKENEWVTIGTLRTLIDAIRRKSL